MPHLYAALLVVLLAGVCWQMCVTNDTKHGAVANIIVIVLPMAGKFNHRANRPGCICHSMLEDKNPPKRPYPARQPNHQCSYVSISSKAILRLELVPALVQCAEDGASDESNLRRRILWQLFPQRPPLSAPSFQDSLQRDEEEGEWNDASGLMWRVTRAAYLVWMGFRNGPHVHNLDLVGNHQLV